MRETVRRELEVMFSREAQPVWFRIAKWVTFIGLAWYLRRRQSKGFWIWIAGVMLAGMGLHLLYRWKTAGWTRSWGRWQYDKGGHGELRDAEPGENGAPPVTQWSHTGQGGSG